jgi:signal transduction histidine kinase
MNDKLFNEKNHDAMFLMRQSTIAWRNMWLIFVIGLTLTIVINPAAFKSHFFAGGLFIYFVCCLLSTFPLRKKSDQRNILAIWYFRFTSELLFMFLVIAYTGRENSVMIIGVGAMFLRFIVCRPYLKEILFMGLFITLMETTVLLTSRQSTTFAFSRFYPAALFLFWFTTIYAYWAVKQYYREKNRLMQKDIENQILIKELQLEKKLHVSEKFATIGQLAAGLAHEIRNPLTAVQGFIQLLKNRELGAKEREYLVIIDEEMQRIGSLVGEFLLLAKPAAPMCKNNSVTALVSEAVNLMQSEAIMKDIRLVTDCCEECYINVDKEQIKQVMINLIKNALEVMSHGKNIFIKTAHDKDKNLCVVTVEDEGPGIPAGDLKKIFDPFFTTKEDGTGLGLAVSFRIVENHGGRLSAQSTPGAGSVFTIELPVIEPSSGGGR